MSEIDIERVPPEDPEFSEQEAVPVEYAPVSLIVEDYETGVE